MIEKQNSYPNNFAEARKRKGYSQKFAAAALGVSRRTLGNYEAGRFKPSVDGLIDMCSLYEAKAEYLCAELFRISKLKIIPKTVQQQRMLPGISDQLEIPAFAPKTVSQFVALRIAQRLKHVSELKRYLVLLEYYSHDFLVTCYRRAAELGNTGEHFVAAFQQLTEQPR